MSAEQFDVDKAITILGETTQVSQGEHPHYGEGVRLTVPSGDMLALYDGYVGVQSVTGPLNYAVFAGNDFSVEYSKNQPLIELFAANPTRVLEFSPAGVHYILFNDHLYANGTNPPPALSLEQAQIEKVHDPKWGEGTLLTTPFGRELGEYQGHVSVRSPFGHAVFTRQKIFRDDWPGSDSIRYSSTNPDSSVVFSRQGIQILLFSKEWPRIPGLPEKKKRKRG